MRRHHEIEIRYGLSQCDLPEAASILYDAFQPKLRPFLRSRDDALPVIQTILDPSRVVAAFRRGAVIGLCGLSQRGQRFLRPRPGPFVRQFGPLVGLALFLASLVLEQPVPRGELMVENLAVRADLRGRGIGTRILQAVHRYARSQGLSAVRLDVVDTNPEAHRLYERLGYRPLRTRRYPFLQAMVGFSAVTTMRWMVGPS